MSCRLVFRRDHQEDQTDRLVVDRPELYPFTEYRDGDHNLRSTGHFAVWNRDACTNSGRSQLFTLPQTIVKLVRVAEMTGADQTFRKGPEQSRSIKTWEI